MQTLRFPSRDEQKEPTHNRVLISSSHTTRHTLLNQASPLILLHQSSPFPIILLTHTSIRGHKREQRNDRGHYHTVMVLTHLNSLAKDKKDGFTADAMGLRNLYSTFLHKRSRCVIFPDLCCRLYYNAWRVCERRIKHSLTLTPTSSVKRKTVSRGSMWIKDTIV